MKFVHLYICTFVHLYNWYFHRFEQTELVIKFINTYLVCDAFQAARTYKRGCSPRGKYEILAKFKCLLIYTSFLFQIC